MAKNNDKKTEQLGMPIGTASNRLRNSIIFMLLKKLNLNFCHQCNAEIEYEDHLSVEHKTPYLDSENPKELFFDLNNIAFSHLNCNIRAARKTLKPSHPNISSYRNGCRCDQCKNLERLRRVSQRERGINT